VYGHWISFHDASLESVLIVRYGPTVTIEFETCDMAHRGDKLVDSDLRARVIIRWHRVQDLNLAGVDPEERNWVDGLTLTTVGRHAQRAGIDGRDVRSNRRSASRDHRRGASVKHEYHSCRPDTQIPGALGKAKMAERVPSASE
jgi:hypothetical protein